MTVRTPSIAGEEENVFEETYPEKGMFLEEQARSGKDGLVHRQVLRIRKEDSHIGQDDGRVSGFRVPSAGGDHQRRELLKLSCRKASELDLRSSPLGGRDIPRSST